MSNVPIFDTDNISIGPGVLFVGPSGTTPTLDVGAIAEDGMEFTVTREFLEVFQGSPKTLIKRFVTEETVELSVQSLEWNLLNLVTALGTGVTTSDGAQDTYSFGGDPDTNDVAVKVQHTLPSGNTISILIWLAQPLGEWTLSLAQDELQTFPFSFKALESTLSWDGVALPVNQKLFRIIREK